METNSLSQDQDVDSGQTNQKREEGKLSKARTEICAVGKTAGVSWGELPLSRDSAFAVGSEGQPSW